MVAFLSYLFAFDGLSLLGLPEHTGAGHISKRYATM